MCEMGVRVRVMVSALLIFGSSACMLISSFSVDDDFSSS